MKHKSASKSVGSGNAVQTTKIPAQPDSPQLLTRRDVAKRWACCEHTVARCEELEPIRFNRRRLRYRLEDVLAIEAAADQQGENQRQWEQAQAIKAAAGQEGVAA
ncbi:MAG: hypothetical protein WCH99_15920 [Verrucomicrobiota bacterium]